MYRNRVHFAQDCISAMKYRPQCWDWTDMMLDVPYLQCPIAEVEHHGTAGAEPGT